MRRLLIVLLLFLLEGCASVEPQLAELPAPRPEALKITPHTYELWRAMERCTGLKGDPRRWTWWTVDGPNVPSDNGRAIGSTHPDTRNIYIVKRMLHDDGLIVHEILHALGVGATHPAIYSACRPQPLYWW